MCVSTQSAGGCSFSPPPLSCLLISQVPDSTSSLGTEFDVPVTGICTVLAALVTLVVLAPQPYFHRECELCVVGITFGLLSAESPALGKLPRT